MPASPPSHDTQIAAEIEELRARHSDTRELYREVCVLLFFRFGITPTANRLYQYVRKGSMSTPAQVLAQFWSDLRERSRVRIDHPDLPPALREAAGELVLELWGQAREAAARGFEAQSAEAAAEIADARRRASESDEEIRALEARVAAFGDELLEARSQSGDLGRQLATIQGRLASMTEMLRDQADEMRELRDELAIARRDVARAVGEANALRVQLTIARHRGSKKPLGGVPHEPGVGQEDLPLDPIANAGDPTRDTRDPTPEAGDPGADSRSRRPPRRPDRR